MSRWPMPLRITIAGAFAIAALWCGMRPLLALQLGVAAAIGAACLGGAALVYLGVRRRRGAAAIVGGAGLIVVGGAAALQPGIAVLLAPVAAGLALTALAVVRARRTPATADRWRRWMWVVAALLLTVLLAVWPAPAAVLTGVAIAVVAIVVVVRLAFRGPRSQRSAAAVSDSPASSASARASAARRPGLAHRIAAWTALTATVVVLGASGTATVALAAGLPRHDGFYTWTGAVPEQPGQLLRVSDYTGQTPEGVRAVRILYSTSDDTGAPRLASAVVAIPTAPAEGARTVLAWQHGTTGVARDCAPSVTGDALTDRGIPGIAEMIERGWVVVATDYPGQGTDGAYPYLIGQAEGRATLDAVRATRAIDDADASSSVMLWGHSQGGHATLWAAQLAASYAPDLDIRAVAALSAAADPLALAEKITAKASAVGALATAYVLDPFSHAYSDISLDDLVEPQARPFVSAFANECTLSTATVVSILSLTAATALDHRPLFELDLTAGPAHDRLAENAVGADLPMPVFLGQGTDDEVIPISIQRDVAARACAAGAPVSVHEYPGRTHMGVIAADSPLRPDLWAWADDVLSGSSPVSCIP